MLNFGSTFVWVAINLFILYLILKRVMFKPVTAFMQNRTNMIKQSIDDAENSKIEADKMKSEYESQLRKARVDVEDIIEAARRKADKEYEKIILSACKDAQIIMDRAKQEVEFQVAQAKKTMRDNILELAITIASKLMGENMDNEKNRLLISNFIDQEEGGAA